VAVLAEMQGAAAGGQVATTILVIGEGAAMFAAFCPSWFTVRSPFFHDQDAHEGNVQAIRQGEAAATLLTVAVGWAASALVRSPLPFFGALGISAVMIAGYEWSIAHPATEASEASRSPLAGALGWKQVAA
jgi:hypothetical protein